MPELSGSGMAWEAFANLLQQLQARLAALAALPRHLPIAACA